MLDIDRSEFDELERVQEFHGFLQGQVPDGVSVQSLPKMTADQAFTVIWFLQEVSGLISDSIEMCAYCGTLFDSYREGHLGDTAEEHYCSPMCESSNGKSTPEEANGTADSPVLNHSEIRRENWLMPEIFGLKTITLGQALGLTFLSSILFKSPTSSK